MVDFSAVLSAPPPPRSGEPTEKIAVGAPALTPPAPAQPEPASGSGAGRWLLIGLLVLGVGAGAYFLGRQGSGPEPVVTADDPEPVDEVSNAPEPPAVEEPEPLDEGPDEVLDEAPDAPAPEPAVRPASTMRRPSAMSAVADRPPAMEPEPAAELEPTPAPQEPAVAAMAPEPELPPHPTRQEVQIALDSVRPQVAACLDGQHGTVRVRVTVRGSGRVTTAVVQDSLYAQPPVGSCIARAVRGAPFPPFSQESFVVLYPFQL